MARAPRLAARIAKPDPVLGIISGHVEPALIELIAQAGYDFYVIDVEHCSASDRELEECVRAGDAAGIPILARLNRSELHRVPHFLDAGGDGIILAHTMGVDDIDTLVAECSYPPNGKRGASTTRIARYGFEPTTEEWLRAEEAALFIGALIEEPEGLEAVDRIAAHPAVDVLFVGTRDLSLALGIPGDLGNTRIVAAMREVEAAAAKYRKPVAAMVRQIASSHGGAQVRLVGIGAILKYAVDALREHAL